MLRVCFQVRELRRVVLSKKLFAEGRIAHGRRVTELRNRFVSPPRCSEKKRMASGHRSRRKESRDSSQETKTSSAYLISGGCSRQLGSISCVLERCSSGAKPEVLEARKERLATVLSIHLVEFACRSSQAVSVESGLPEDSRVDNLGDSQAGRSFLLSLMSGFLQRPGRTFQELYCFGSIQRFRYPYAGHLLVFGPSSTCSDHLALTRKGRDRPLYRAPQVFPRQLEKWRYQYLGS